jgi:alpha-N-arabinofuranosidase
VDVSVLVDPTFRVGRINRGIYGQFIEHVGRCIYGGVWVGEGSKIPNEKGFRRDVLEAVSELRPSLVRWPGGNFASNYHWMDGVGPRRDRPKKLDMAWGGLDPNEFGTCEFIEWCRMIGAEPYLVVNAGNGTPEEAARWVEFCNFSADTYYTSLRAGSGYREPFKVQLWGVGNELYGDWQVGYCLDGKECARRTIEFANEMKKVDPTIELVAVGCDSDMEWNIDMVKHAGRYFEHLSVHRYFFTRDMSYEDILSEPFIWERMLRSVYDSITITAKKAGLKKEIGVAFDEWNLWNPEAIPPAHDQVTTLRDGIFTALVLNSLQRLCREVRIACFAQTVNVLPLIATDDEGRMYVNPQYLAFKLYGNTTQDVAVKCSVDSSTFYSRRLNQSLDYCDAVASISNEGDKVAIQIVNASPAEEALCQIRIKSFRPSEAEASYVGGRGLEDRNNFEDPRRVTITSGKASVKNGLVEYVAPRHSISSVIVRGVLLK